MLHLNPSDPRFFHPDGRRKTAQERAQYYAANHSPKPQQAVPLDPYYNLPRAEREQIEQRHALAESIAREEQRSKELQSGSPFERELARLQESLAWCKSPAERRKTELRIEIYQRKVNEEKQAAAMAARQQEYLQSPLIQNCQQHAQAISRTPPHESLRAECYSASLLLQDGWRTRSAEEINTAYWQAVSLIERKAEHLLMQQLETKKQELEPGNTEVQELQVKLDSLRGEQ